MKLPSLAEIEAGGEIVYELIRANSQLGWPILNERAGVELWIKHENYNPAGAFKFTGGMI